MANPHFGNVGDVWKHLLVAAVLQVERPSRYWDSHAGLAINPHRGKLEREVGYRRYLERVSKHPQLENSAYTAALRAASQRGYPGSAWIAVWLLGAGTHYLLCEEDRETACLLRAGIEEVAGSSDYELECVVADGPSTLIGRASDDGTANSTLALLDPFNPAGGTPSPIDAFSRLARRGIKTMLWYPVIHADAGRATTSELRAAIRQVSDLDAKWPAATFVLRDHVLAHSKSIRGSGMMLANVRIEACARCAELGTELEALYEEANFEMESPSRRGTEAVAP